MTKTAVILLNLGGPDGREAVRPFLFNLFNDPAIIRLPQPFRFLLANQLAAKRTKTLQAIYAKVGGRSPILQNTEAQARMLEAALADASIKCFVAMRYWHPFAQETAAQVKKFAPDNVVLLPLYPQFSTTTTASSLKSWQQATRQAGLNAPAKTICCYPTEPGFIRALARLTHKALGEAQARGKPRLLFSAHGLPEKIVRAGDPYPWQCKQTAEALVRELNTPALDWVLCYQSRVGPLKWIGPSTEEEIHRAGADKVSVVVVPIAFVSEHSETLVEIDMDYRAMAVRAGVPFFTYTGTVSTAPDFIAGLAALVRKAAADRRNCISASDARLCPPDFPGCCQNEN
jgi:ferrochelatase